MSEIEKLYKNAGVGYLMYVLDTFPSVAYPQIDFTTEKQLELFKWLIKYRWYIIGRYTDKFDLFDENFEQALAGILNSLWQDLTKEEQEQIRSILNGN